MTVVRHGVSANTPDRLLIDAGAVYFKATDDWTVASPGTLLGATRGGNTFEVTRTIKRIDPDGSKGPVKGFRRIEDVVAVLTANLIEITEANLLMALPGSSATSHVITGAEIDDADYIANVVIVGTITGFDGTAKPIICKLKNCLADGPFALKMDPKGEAVQQMKFTAHYLDSDLSTEPWSIEYPA
jgi:hypothetical protein